MKLQNTHTCVLYVYVYVTLCVRMAVTVWIISRFWMPKNAQVCVRMCVCVHAFVCACSCMYLCECVCSNVLTCVSLCVPTRETVFGNVWREGGVSPMLCKSSLCRFIMTKVNQDSKNSIWTPDQYFFPFCFFLGTIFLFRHFNALPRFDVKLNPSTRDTTWRACRREHWKRSERGSANLHVITSISLSRWLPTLLFLRQSLMFTGQSGLGRQKMIGQKNSILRCDLLIIDYISHRQDRILMSIRFKKPAANLICEINATNLPDIFRSLQIWIFCENPPKFCLRRI